jgi:hypothetical protein
MALALPRYSCHTPIAPHLALPRLGISLSEQWQSTRVFRARLSYRQHTAGVYANRPASVHNVLVIPTSIAGVTSKRLVNLTEVIVCGMQAMTPSRYGKYLPYGAARAYREKQRL